MSGPGAPKEFSFVGQDGGGAAEAAAEVQADMQYPMAGTQYPHEMMAPAGVYGSMPGRPVNPYAYGPPYGPAYGSGGYGGMGASG